MTKFVQVSSEEEHDGGRGHHGKLEWLPRSLKISSLAAFAGFYLVLAAILGVLAGVSRNNDGICVVNSDYRYWWTYVPTAVFTLLSVLWSQVDYRARSLMPWVLLKSSPSAAGRTVLLDYVSPNVFSAWARSLKARDMPVALALTGTLLNKLLVILSTGLFTLAAVTVLLEPKNATEGKSFSASGFNTSAVNHQAVSRVFGTHTLNMSYPFGTTTNYSAEIPLFLSSKHAVTHHIPLELLLTNLVKQTMKSRPTDLQSTSSVHILTAKLRMS